MGSDGSLFFRHGRSESCLADEGTCRTDSRWAARIVRAARRGAAARESMIREVCSMEVVVKEPLSKRLYLSWAL